MHSKFRFFLLLALLISIILEMTLFNYTHYATLFTSEHFSIEYYNKITGYKQEQKFEGNVNYSLDGISFKDSLLLPEPQGQLKFTDLNTEIASIYINPIFIQGDKQRVKIIWADEEFSGRSIDVSIVKGLDFSNYITIAPCRKVSNLNIQFLDNNIAIKQVELNKEIPRAIMPIRMIIVFCISLLLLCLLNAEFHQKISYFCFDYLYDNTNFRQYIGFAMLICFMLVFNFLNSYLINGFKDNEVSAKWLKMYSHHMTDALLKKQLHLDIKVPRALLEAEKPYDYEYREQRGIHLDTSLEGLDTENDVLTDVAFYNGKFYSYFGIVPVIILFAPYKLVTGNYLPNSMAAFLFGSIATILLMLLWKQIAQNYLIKIPYFFFLIGGAALYCCSLIPTFLVLAFFYHLIAQYSALVFVIFGVIILLQAKEKFSIKLFFVSSLSFALAVGCRPNALFCSILIPVMLWDKRKELINSYLHILAIIIPFAIVGSILAWYNYARFDSFTFGQHYTMMIPNNGFYSQVGIIGQIHLLIETFLFILFNSPNLDFTFPFISSKITNFQIAVPNLTLKYGGIVGIFCFPITWFLFYVRKVNILRNFVFVGIFISLLNMVLIAFISISWRYTMDFSWILAIGSLICAFQLQKNEIAARKVILKIFYSCCIITLLIVFFFAINNFPKIYYYQIHHYLARTFGVICNVP